MKPTLTILLSDKRSGSTLLERELCAHSGVNHSHYTEHSHYETLFWVKAAWLLPVKKRQSFEGVYAGSYGSPPTVRKSLATFLQRNIPDFVIPDDDEALVFDGWTALCEHFAQPVFFEKSPQHPHHWAALELLLSWIQKTNLQVRVIGLVRNPMAVMYSAFQLFQTSPEARQFGWAVAYRNILKFRDLLQDDQFFSIRYEDIVKNPVPEFSKLCRFIGIEYEDKVGQSVHGDSIAKWKMDPFYTLQLHPDVARLARAMGYSDEELLNPPKAKPTAHLRLRNYLGHSLKRRKTKAYNFLKSLRPERDG